MSKLSIVISREFSERTRKKSFWIMTFLTPILMLALIAVPSLIMIWGGGTETRVVVVVDKTNVIFPQLKSDKSIVFCDSQGKDYPEAQNLYPEAYGVLVIPESVIASNSEGLRFYTKESSTIDLERNLQSSVEKIVEQIRMEQAGIAGLDSIMNKIKADLKINAFEVKENDNGETEEKESSAFISLAVSYITAFIIYMFILLYGSQVLQGIVDEKQNRILELVVSSVKPFDLMMGKILGIASVAFTQLVMWIVIFVLGCISFGIAMTPETLNVPMDQETMQMAMSQASDADNILGSLMSVLTDWSLLVRVIGTFVLMFVGGYLLYASLFAAIGSAVDNIQDTQQLQLPVTVPLMIALFMMMAVMQEPNSQMAVWGSIIPFTSPIVMMARISYGVPVWQWVACVVALYGTFAFTTWFAARVYRVGIFMYGKKPSIKDLIRWAKYK